MHDGKHSGRGEAAGVYYLDDDAEHDDRRDRGQASRHRGRHRSQVAAGLLPAGGARNALDCALWELEARRTGPPVWELAGLVTARPLLTTFTLGAEVPRTWPMGASSYAIARALKLKLTGDMDLDIDRVRAVRAARPDAWIGVDANQGYAIDALKPLIADLRMRSVVA